MLSRPQVWAREDLAVFRIALLILALFTQIGLLGCAAHQTLPPSTRVGVLPFPLAQTVEVSRFEGADDTFRQLGVAMADSVVKGFEERHVAAQVISESDRAGVDLLVSGEITKIDGGNRALRALIGMGAGGSTCAVSGTVERRDGTRVGTFGIERKKRSAGFFWARFGESSDRQVDEIFRSIGQSVADMVIEGKYGGGRPGYPAPGRPSLEGGGTVAAGPRPVEDRLRDLDKLRSQGLVTDDEYRDRRKAILDQL